MQFLFVSHSVSRFAVKERGTYVEVIEYTVVFIIINNKLICREGERGMYATYIETLWFSKYIDHNIPLVCFHVIFVRYCRTAIRKE